MATTRWCWNDTRENFLNKVSPEPNTGCWLWIGSFRNEDGYGSFRNGKRNVSAHRYSWELENGPIPPGFELDHLCRVRSCVNPRHLRIVTPRQNTLAPGAETPAKRNAEKTHCRNGHELHGDNISVWQGHRRCKVCRRKSVRS